MSRSRFAPSTTGEAHPGTFLSAMLVWLDARAHGLEVVLRFEDLDPQRCTPERLEQMRRDLRWLGIPFDYERVQSEDRAIHEAALDRLEAAGALYPCSLTRAQVRAGARRAPDGSWAVDNSSRDRELPVGGWRASDEPLRARLPDGAIRLEDESGLVIEHALSEFGDPIVRRRDGAVAYQLASVVDDADLDVTRIVRGRDLLAGTVVQIALQRLLGIETPTYRHHLLLLERRNQKLSKFHGAVGASELRRHYAPESLLGVLAFAAGIIDREEPVALAELAFDWDRVRRDDRVVDVADGQLVIR